MICGAWMMITYHTHAQKLHNTADLEIQNSFYFTITLITTQRSSLNLFISKLNAFICIALLLAILLEVTVDV